MQTTKLKTYAPKARCDFIAAVTRRAASFGLSAKGISPVREEGEVVVIEGQPYPKRVGAQRARLAERIRRQGFEQVMEATAYTWFNRFAAIRFMELHGYLDHSFRVLSHPAGGTLPEILEQAQHVELSGLDRQRIIAQKMDGTQDEALYRDLLLAQCRALHRAMPFLFEPVDDETELLLPDNLLQTNSLIRELVAAIPEADWQEIEIIGWLYQFYISEKKDQVIGKVVKSEDIPAATQLFTPNWIVKYLVQNSLGAQWLATYPDSPLKAQMDYYIEPAEQTEEVKAQLAAITPKSLNPEELTLMDPACGSGHILVEAYELFKAIYMERGYRLRDIPRLILGKNLFGLDIDDRAAQLAGFALMMKAREDDRRLLERGVKLNVMALVDSAGFGAEALVKGVELSDYGLTACDLTELKRLFEHATTFGSLIQVPEGLAKKLPALNKLSVMTSQDLFVSEALEQLSQLAKQAEFLAEHYDAVVANPPYMGIGSMNAMVKNFAKKYFPDAKSDLFACFIERGYMLAKETDHTAMVTMQSWMFLSGFQNMRERILREKTICTMMHLGARAFGSISGEVVQAAAFVLRNCSPLSYKPVFFRLLDGGEEDKRTALARGDNRFDSTSQDQFKMVPGSPLTYWASNGVYLAFQGPKFTNVVSSQGYVLTGNNAKYLRFLWEVDAKNVGRASRWRQHPRGGDFRKWYGNVLEAVAWSEEARAHYRNDPVGRIPDPAFWDLEGMCWSEITVSQPSFRVLAPQEIANKKSPTIYPKLGVDSVSTLGYLNSAVSKLLLSFLNPTIGFGPGDILRLPVPSSGLNKETVNNATQQCITLARTDWNVYERSWDFQYLPILTASTSPTPTLESSYTAWLTQNRKKIGELKRLEEENNRLFIDAHGLQDELTPDVPIEQITLKVNPAYRYGKKLSDDDWSVEQGFPDELETRFREDTMQELVSYAIGCAMGRYSLDEPGLIYAHSANVGFDSSRYRTFPADADGIIPITDTDWFDDDATHRVVEFISVAWDKSHLEENLQFLADNLSPKRGETSRDTLRRYLADKFYKDHLQTYKKRPIYWCFSSGRQKAFQCLVYLHRYHPGTLARMRMEYVVPLQSKMAARIDSLADDIQAASSSAQAKRLQKERDTLTKQLEELRRFDEQLRHYADQRIALDLDDGVKVNYGKFGDLLAEVKTVTGTSAD